MSCEDQNNYSRPSYTKMKTRKNGFSRKRNLKKTRKIFSNKSYRLKASLQFQIFHFISFLKQFSRRYTYLPKIYSSYLICIKPLRVAAIFMYILVLVFHLHLDSPQLQLYARLTKCRDVQIFTPKLSFTILNPF